MHFHDILNVFHLTYNCTWTRHNLVDIYKTMSHTYAKPTPTHRQMSQCLMSIIHRHGLDTFTHVQLKYEAYFFVFLF